MAAWKTWINTNTNSVAHFGGGKAGSTVDGGLPGSSGRAATPPLRTWSSQSGSGSVALEWLSDIGVAHWHLNNWAWIKFCIYYNLTWIQYNLIVNLWPFMPVLSQLSAAFITIYPRFNTILYWIYCKLCLIYYDLMLCLLQINTWLGLNNIYLSIITIYYGFTYCHLLHCHYYHLLRTTEMVVNGYLLPFIT